MGVVYANGKKRSSKVGGLGSSKNLLPGSICSAAAGVCSWRLYGEKHAVERNETKDKKLETKTRKSQGVCVDCRTRNQA